MNKLLPTLVVYLKLNLKIAVEYRSDFALGFVRHTLELVLAVVFLKVIYQNTQRLSGYNENELLFLYGTFFLAKSFVKIFCEHGLVRVSRLVREGKFDFVLVKPVDAQIVASFMGVDFRDLSKIFFGLYLMVYSLKALNLEVGLLTWLTFTFLIVLSTTIYYSLYLIVATFSFWLTETRSLESFFSELIELGKLPRSVWPAGARFFLTYFLPLVFLAAVPAEAILRQVSWPTVVGALLLSLFFLYFSRRFWLFGLRFYTSASS